MTQWWMDTLKCLELMAFWLSLSFLFKLAEGIRNVILWHNWDSQDQDRSSLQSLVCILNLSNLEAMEKSLSTRPWIFLLQYVCIQCLTQVLLSFSLSLFSFFHPSSGWPSQLVWKRLDLLVWRGDSHQNQHRFCHPLELLQQFGLVKEMSWPNHTKSHTEAPYSGWNQGSLEGGSVQTHRPSHEAVWEINLALKLIHFLCKQAAGQRDFFFFFFGVFKKVRLC